MPPLRNLLLLALVSATGCAADSRLHFLDDEVGAMIRERQAETLHQPDLDDPEPLVPLLSYTGRTRESAWDKTPGTGNPGVADLEARTDTGPAGNPPGGPAAAAAKPKDLDLNGLLAQAIASAPEYRTAKENLMITALALVVERRAWGPRFFADVGTNLSGTPEAGDHDTAANLIGELGVAQRLPGGGEASVSALSSFTSYLAQSSANSAFSDAQNTRLRLALSMPLMRGSGRIAQESLIQGERNLVYAARDFETFRRGLMVDFSGVYFRLLQNQKAIENQKKRLESLDQSNRRLRALVTAGSAAPIDADNAELQARNAQAGLAAAEDAYRDALDRLKVRLGLPLDTALGIIPGEMQVPVPVLELAGALAQTKAGRLDLQNSRDRLDDAARRAEIARDGLRGDLTLSGGTSLNSDPAKRYGGVTPLLGASSYDAGLKYSLPLFRIPEEAALRQSLIGVEQANRAYGITVDTIEANVRSAIRNIQRSRITLDLQEKNIQLAERRLEQTKLRERDLGFRPVLDAENDLLDARNNRDQALTDLRLSILRYLNETGQIRVDPQGRWVPPGKLVPLPQAVEGIPQ